MFLFGNSIRRWTAGAALPFALFATQAFAQQSAKVDILVNLTVQDGCVINGGTSPTSILSFGTIQNPGALSVDLTAQGDEITILCNVDSTTAAFQIDNGDFDLGGVHRLGDGALFGNQRFVNYHVFASPTYDSALEYVNGVPIPIGSVPLIGGPALGTLTAGNPAKMRVYGLIYNADFRNARANTYGDTLHARLTF